MFLLLIDHTSNNVICTVNNSSYVTDNVPAGFSSYTALQFLLLSLENLSHAAWNHLGSIVSCQILPSFVAVKCFACLPSACEWKTTTEAVVDGWKGLFISSSSFAAEKEEESVGSSLSVMLAGRAGSRASIGAMMQWDSRHSGFTLKGKTSQY